MIQISFLNLVYCFFFNNTVGNKLSNKNKEKHNLPEGFWKRINEFAKPFYSLMALSLILNIIFSTFSALTIAIIKPLINVLNSKKEVEAAVKKVTEPGFFGDIKIWLEGLKESFNDSILNVVQNPDSIEATLFNMSLLIITLFLVKNLFKYFGSIAAMKLEEGFIKHVRDIVFAHLINLSVDFFGQRKEGELITIVTNDISILNTTTVSSVNIIIRELTQIIFFLALLIAISVDLTLIAFSTSIISLLIIKFAMKFLRRYATRMQNAISDFTSTLQESISGIRVLKAYNAEAKASNAFEENTEKFLKSSVKHKKIITIIPAINEIFAILALCVVLFVGGVAISDGNLSFDDLWLFLVSLFGIMSPITTVIDTVSKFQRGIVSAGRIFKLLDAQSTVVSGDKTIETFKEKISVKNLSFAYEDIPILKDVSFDIEKGKKVAFVGPSGSGKSTMLDLLIRFYDPASGSILIDDDDIKSLNSVDYRSLFGIVSQETILFNDSIAGNIRFGKPEASLEEVQEAAKDANAYNYISQTQDGFGTNVGDRGTKLSGGERQRLAIARALVRNPEILVFDEATSALDSESEQIVQEAINKNLEDRTAVIVAHRLATIIHCDTILVFDKGEIVERGSHTELLEKGGLYKKLYDIQFAEQSKNI